MKYSVIFTTIIVMGLSSQIVFAGEITDTYAAGDTLTATKMENIKTAVNDNDGKINTNILNIGFNKTDITQNASDITQNASDITQNATDITQNASDITQNASDITTLQAATNSVLPKVFDSRIRYQIPVLTTMTGNTSVVVWLSNHSSTSCNAYLAGSINSWQVGSNTKSSLLIRLVYSQTFMTELTRSGVFPLLTTTYTIVARSNMTSDVSTKDYVDVSLIRSETSTSDTCNVGDIYVRGAMVTYPNGSKYFVPVTDMVVL